MKLKLITVLIMFITFFSCENSNSNSKGTKKSDQFEISKSQTTVQAPTISASYVTMNGYLHPKVTVSNLTTEDYQYQYRDIYESGTTWIGPYTSSSLTIVDQTMVKDTRPDAINRYHWRVRAVDTVSRPGLTLYSAWSNIVTHNVWYKPSSGGNGGKDID